jgi:hypothetical protein
MIKTIEIRRFDGEDRLFVDNQLFDWGIDEEALSQIDKISNKEDIEKIHENIKNFFLDCFSSMIGNKINIKQAYEAIVSGQIEV